MRLRFAAIAAVLGAVHLVLFLTALQIGFSTANAGVPLPLRLTNVITILGNPLIYLRPFYGGSLRWLLGSPDMALLTIPYTLLNSAIWGTGLAALVVAANRLASRFRAINPS
jgi:hypothetical protein